MKPTDLQIEQTILAVSLRLIEPIMQCPENIHFQTGYQTVLYILHRRITDMEQISRLHFDNEITHQMAQMAVSYQLGECLKFDLLYMPIQRLPDEQQQKALQHGKMLYEEIQRTSAEELSRQGLTGFVDALQIIREQHGIIETFLFIADMRRRNKKPIVHLEALQPHLN